MSTPMTLVATYSDRGKARAAQAILENTGIPSTLIDAGTAPYSQSEANMRLLVTPHLAAKAKALLGITPPQRKVLGIAVSILLLSIAVLFATLKPH